MFQNGLRKTAQLLSFGLSLSASALPELASAQGSEIPKFNWGQNPAERGYKGPYSAAATVAVERYIATMKIPDSYQVPTAEQVFALTSIKPLPDQKAASESKYKRAPQFEALIGNNRDPERITALLKWIELNKPAADGNVEVKNLEYLDTYRVQNPSSGINPKFSYNESQINELARLPVWSTDPVLKMADGLPGLPFRNEDDIIKARISALSQSSELATRVVYAQRFAINDHAYFEVNYLKGQEEAKKAQEQTTSTPILPDEIVAKKEAERVKVEAIADNAAKEKRWDNQYNIKAPDDKKSWGLGTFLASVAAGSAVLLTVLAGRSYFARRRNAAAAEATPEPAAAADAVDVEVVDDSIPLPPARRDRDSELY